MDFFLVLLLAGGGDDLQGIKKGVVELADMIAINKADGDNIERATRSAAEYQGALNILTPLSPNWSPPVVTVSGRDDIGIDDLWARILDHHRIMSGTGEFAERRSRQSVSAMRGLLGDRLMETMLASPGVGEALQRFEAAVGAGKTTPALAVEEVIEMWHASAKT